MVSLSPEGVVLLFLAGVLAGMVLGAGLWKPPMYLR
jgi:hypothetical protein